MIKEIKTKTILSKTKNPYKWFGIMYNVNFYRGCIHRCIYCDSRSECYGVNDFDNDVEVKVNAIELLSKELQSRRIKGTIGTGSMCDCYMGIESKYKITSRALQLIDAYDYPVCVITKSDLVLSDILTLENINKNTYATVIFTITTTSDDLARVIEPYASVPSKRLFAMKKLKERGIHVGVLLMPILPFINDTKENILDIVRLSYEAGAEFIIPSFGVTLRDRQRSYFYNELDKSFKGLKDRYIKTYGNSYSCRSLNSNALYSVFVKECIKYGIVYEMSKVKSYESISSIIQLSMDL